MCVFYSSQIKLSFITNISYICINYNRPYVPGSHKILYLCLLMLVISVSLPAQEKEEEWKHNRRSIAAWVVGRYLRSNHQPNDRMVNRLMADIETDKSIYHLPKSIQFPRPVSTRITAGMQVFYMDPEDDCPLTVIYIHGGSYIKTFTKYHWRFLSKLARRTGCALVVPNYPLLPQHNAEDAHPVMMDFYREIVSKYDMSRTVIMGDSAGGGFALALMEEAQAEDLPLPARMVLLSPWVDVDGGNYDLDRKDAMIDLDCVKRYGIAWAGNLDVRNRIVSPLYGNLKGLPEADIYAGSWEVLIDDCRSVVDGMNAGGTKAHLHVGKKMGHVYPLYPIPEAKPAVTEIVNIVRSIGEDDTLR